VSCHTRVKHLPPSTPVTLLFLFFFQRAISVHCVFIKMANFYCFLLDSRCEVEPAFSHSDVIEQGLWRCEWCKLQNPLRAPRTQHNHRHNHNNSPPPGYSPVQSQETGGRSDPILLGSSPTSSRGALTPPSSRASLSYGVHRSPMTHRTSGTSLTSARGMQVARVRPSTVPQAIKQERQDPSPFFAARGQAERERQEKGKVYKEREKQDKLGQYKGAQTFNMGINAWIARAKHQSPDGPYPLYKGLPDGEGRFTILKQCTVCSLILLGLLCTGIQNMQVPENINTFILGIVRSQWARERSFLSPSPIHPTRGTLFGGAWCLGKTVINGHATNVQDLVQEQHQGMMLIEWFQMHFPEKVSKNVIEFTVHILWKEPLRPIESSSEDDISPPKRRSRPAISPPRRVHSSRSPIKRAKKEFSLLPTGKGSSISSSTCKIKIEKDTKPSKIFANTDNDTATQHSIYQRRLGEARTTLNSTGQVPGRENVVQQVRDVISYHIKNLVSELALKLEWLP
jgi:hypothetical protein